MFISYVRSLQSGFKKKTLKDKEKREEGNRQCNTHNELKRRIIPSHKTEMGYVQSHTTAHNTKHTNYHIKIPTNKNPYSCTLCGKGSISSSHIKSHLKIHDYKNLNHYALCGRKFISRNHLNMHIKRNTGKNLYNCAMWQNEYLQEPNKETHERSC